MIVSKPTLMQLRISDYVIIVLQLLKMGRIRNYGINTDFSFCNRLFYRGIYSQKNRVGTAVFSPEDHDDLVFPDTVIAAHIDSNIILLPYLFVAWKMPSVPEGFYTRMPSVPVAAP